MERTEELDNVDMVDGGGRDIVAHLKHYVQILVLI